MFAVRANQLTLRALRERSQVPHDLPRVYRKAKELLKPKLTDHFNYPG